MWLGKRCSDLAMAIVSSAVVEGGAGELAAGTGSGILGKKFGVAR